MSTYNPRNVRVWDPTPQTSPELFDDADLMKEIRYLRATNRRHGEHTLRTLAIVRLTTELARRKAARGGQA